MTFPTLESGPVATGQGRTLSYKHLGRVVVVEGAGGELLPGIVMQESERTVQLTKGGPHENVNFVHVAVFHPRLGVVPTKCRWGDSGQGTCRLRMPGASQPGAPSTPGEAASS